MGSDISFSLRAFAKQSDKSDYNIIFFDEQKRLKRYKIVSVTYEVTFEHEFETKLVFKLLTCDSKKGRGGAATGGTIQY